MIAQGLLTQIAMIGLAIGIAVFYIEPTFAQIGEMQDEIALYQTERQKVDEVNNQLTTLIDRLEQISSTDQQRLATFIPDTVDTIAVPRVLQTIVEETGMVFRDFSYNEIEQDYVTRALNDGVDDFSIPHSFSLGASGTYEQLKTLLTLFEQNEYPLEVHQLEISVGESETFLDVGLTLITYAHTEQPPSVLETINN